MTGMKKRHISLAFLIVTLSYPDSRAFSLWANRSAKLPFCKDSRLEIDAYNVSFRAERGICKDWEQ